MGNGTFWSINIADYIQIAFWLVVGGLSILTYVQAKRSFFQPLRIEVFKLQLALLTRVSDLFVSKSETDLRNFFDFGEIIRINTHVMAEEYAKEVEAQIPKGQGILEREREIVAGAQILLESTAAVRLISAPSDADEKDVPPEPEPTWEMYEHTFLYTTKQYESALLEIESLSREPLLPSKLRDLLEALVKTALSNLDVIRLTLHDAAAKMPTSYPTFESLRGAELGWVSNIWNRKSTPLEPIAHEIVDFTREYFAPEMIGFSRANGVRKSKSKGKARVASTLLE